MTTSFNQQRRTSRQSALFGIAVLILMFCSAGLAAFAPVAFSIAAVFLFAAPHNWVELRYCISRLPSRFGPLAKFFATSFGGLGLLFLSYLTLVICARNGLIEQPQGIFLGGAWNLLLIGWVVALGCLRFNKRAITAKSVVIGLCVAAFSITAPRWFALSLVYLHPFVGMVILEKELKRNNRAWLVPYRRCLALLPIFIAAIVAFLANAPNLEPASMLELQIARHSGSSILPDVSSHLLVSLHTFLEMLHYGVWCIAIPLAAGFTRNWTPKRFAISANRPGTSLILALVLLASTLAVIGFSAGFMVDYALTRDIYFILAMVHVLAEIPLIFWMFPAKRDNASSTTFGSAGQLQDSLTPPQQMLEATG
jgi:hypothetical protein